MTISPGYHKAMVRGGIVQIFVVFFSGTILDGGAVEQLCVMALLPFWIAAGMLVWRRPHEPTRVDLAFVRIGYLLVVAATSLLAPFIWRLRGML